MYDVNRMIKENIFKEDQMDMLRKIVVFYLAAVAFLAGGVDSFAEGTGYQSIPT